MKICKASERYLEKYETSLERRAIVIGCVVFITALIAQICIWDIFGHMKMVKSMTVSSNLKIYSNSTQNFTIAASNCSQFDKCECTGKNRAADMSFITGELARKHVEERFQKISDFTFLKLLLKIIKSKVFDGLLQSCQFV